MMGSRVEELLTAANAKAAAGDLAGALHDLDAAAARPEADADERAWCLHLGATAARLLGEVDGARRRAAAALAVAEPASRAWVGATVELGEAELARLDPEAARTAFDRLLALQGDVTLTPEARIGVLRRRALAWRLSGQPARAAEDLAAAAELGEPDGDDLSDRIARLGALVADGLPETDPERLEREAVAVGLRAVEAGDQVALADLAFLEADVALRTGDHDRAFESLRRARAAAAEAGDAVRYVGTVTAISELAAHCGDDAAAYEPLATGWATLTRVVGADLARSALRPRLLRLRAEIGVGRFEAAKRAYEEQRRPAG